MLRRAQRITADTGRQHVVDHIVPLVNPLVCGLHCQANWRIVTAEINQAKSNHVWPDMPYEQFHLLEGNPFSSRQMRLPAEEWGV